jgi:hypothetical protein
LGARVYELDHDPGGEAHERPSEVAHS